MLCLRDGKLFKLLRHVKNRGDPIVSPAIMTAQATPARFRFFKLNGNFPFAVGELFTDMLGLIACMSGMAGTTRASLFRHIYMPIMKVGFSVSEFSQIFGFLD